MFQCIIKSKVNFKNLVEIFSSFNKFSFCTAEGNGSMDLSLLLIQKMLTQQSRVGRKIQILVIMTSVLAAEENFVNKNIWI